MSKLDESIHSALDFLRQTGHVFYRVLDGLGRLGMVPWELLPLAAFGADFILNLATVLWISARQACGAMGRFVRRLTEGLQWGTGPISVLRPPQRI